MEKRFYQLTTMGVPAAVVKMAEMVINRGQTLEIVCPNEQRKREIDEILWEDVEFLPHAIDERDRFSKVLVTQDCQDFAEVCLVLDEANEHATNSKLKCYLFHNVDQDIVEKRRKDWVTWKQSGDHLTYWAQNGEGAWGKKSEINQPE